MLVSLHISCRIRILFSRRILHTMSAPKKTVPFVKVVTTTLKTSQCDTSVAKKTPNTSAPIKRKAAVLEQSVKDTVSAKTTRTMAETHVKTDQGMFCATVYHKRNKFLQRVSAMRLCNGSLRCVSATGLCDASLQRVSAMGFLPWVSYHGFLRRVSATGFYHGFPTMGFYHGFLRCVSAMGVCYWFLPWVSDMGFCDASLLRVSYHGFLPWVSATRLCYGFLPWVSTMGFYHGFLRRVSATGVCHGFLLLPTNSSYCGVGGK